MNLYETMFILRNDIDEEVKSEFIERLKNAITKNGGEVTGFSSWGKRKLAYTINKIYREGEYFLMYFRGNKEVNKEIEHIFRISEVMIRYIMVRDEGKDSQEKEEI